MITRLRNHASIDYNYERTFCMLYVAMQMCYIVRHQLPWQLCNYNTDMYVTLYNYVFGMVMIM